MRRSTPQNKDRDLRGCRPRQWRKSYPWIDGRMDGKNLVLRKRGIETFVDVARRNARWARHSPPNGTCYLWSPSTLAFDWVSGTILSMLHSIHSHRALPCVCPTTSPSASQQGCHPPPPREETPIPPLIRARLTSGGCGHVFRKGEFILTWSFGLGQVSHAKKALRFGFFEAQ